MSRSMFFLTRGASMGIYGREIDCVTHQKNMNFLVEKLGETGLPYSINVARLLQFVGAMMEDHITSRADMSPEDKRIVQEVERHLLN